ncbi:MAG: peptidoglycan editing factor PgeF [Patescibacteria group bacterium]|nr:peptidoglycan editing factor PgeF [Patescibacteria group bacterium]
MSASLFAQFAAYPNLVVALSERDHGSMTAGGDRTRDRAVTANRERFFHGLGIVPTSVVRPTQVHGKHVATIERTHGKVPAGDGLLTNRPGIFLSVTVADCLPVFLYDPGRSVIGVLHGGWRSLALGIVAEAMDRITDKLKSRPEKLLVGIGPGISRCHFVVRQDTAERFAAYPQAFARVGEQTALDLKQVVVAQFVERGVRREHIEVHPDCTACLPEKYFSYRRDKPAVVEAMVALIGIK